MVMFHSLLYIIPMVAEFRSDRYGEDRETKPEMMLVGGLEHEFYFTIQLGMIIPTDFHIFQRG
jgi:hypothetical protein